MIGHHTLCVPHRVAVVRRHVSGHVTVLLHPMVVILVRALERKHRLVMLLVAQVSARHAIVITFNYHLIQVQSLPRINDIHYENMPL